MKPAARSCVAFAHVASVPRSIEFYANLGFSPSDTFTPDGSDDPAWAYLESGDARLMVAKAGEPVVPQQQAVLFYLYFDEVVPVHAELDARGLQPGAVSHPFYCPKGEFRLTDPDGYCLMITHV